MGENTSCVVEDKVNAGNFSKLGGTAKTAANAMGSLIDIFLLLSLCCCANEHIWLL